MDVALVTLRVVNACQRRLRYVINAVLAPEGLLSSTNKLEHFNYKDEWANV